MPTKTRSILMREYDNHKFGLELEALATECELFRYSPEAGFYLRKAAALLK